MKDQGLASKNVKVKEQVSLADTTRNSEGTRRLARAHASPSLPSLPSPPVHPHHRRRSIQESFPQTQLLHSNPRRTPRRPRFSGQGNSSRGESELSPPLSSLSFPSSSSSSFLFFFPPRPSSPCSQLPLLLLEPKQTSRNRCSLKRLEKPLLTSSFLESSETLRRTSKVLLGRRTLLLLLLMMNRYPWGSST